MAGCWSLLKTGINLHGYLKFSVFMINSCVRTLRNSIWQVLPPRDKPQVFAFFYFRLFVCFYFSVTFSLISYFQMPDNFVQKQWPVCKQIRQGKLPVQDCERFHCCLVHEQRRKNGSTYLEESTPHGNLRNVPCDIAEVIQTPHCHFSQLPFSVNCFPLEYQTEF